MCLDYLHYITFFYLVCIFFELKLVYVHTAYMLAINTKLNLNVMCSKGLIVSTIMHINIVSNKKTTTSTNTFSECH